MPSTLDMQGLDNHISWKRKAAVFLTSQTISLFGSSVVQFAIIWHITLTTSSGAMVTVSTVCSFLPQVLISLFAGVWADRYNRKFLIIFADVAIAISTLALAVLFLIGYKELWLLFAVSAIRSMGTGVQLPAVGALLPQFVPQEKLMRVNGINGSIQALMMLLSPGVSGIILSFYNLEAAFFVDVFTAAIAVCIMLFLPVTAHKKANEKQAAGYLDDLRLGIKYTLSHKLIKRLLIFYAVFMFLVTPAALLTPLMTARTFGEEVWRLTANEVSFSVGAMIGGLIIASWGGFRNRIHTLAFASIFFALFTAAIGLSTGFTVYLAVIFMTGIFMPMLNSSSTVLLQETVEEAMMGRVFGLAQIVASISLPLGMLVFGPAADAVKVEYLLIVSGILMAIPGILIVTNKNIIPVHEKKDYD